MKRMLMRGIVAGAVSVVAFSSPASAVMHYASAQFCAPYTGQGYLVYYRGGTNTNTSSQSVYCPAAGVGNVISVASSSLTYTDTSSTQLLSCRTYVSSRYIDLLSSPKYSCATPGGCSTADPAYAGGVNTLSWVDPLVGDETRVAVWGAGVYCTMPASAAWQVMINKYELDF